MSTRLSCASNSIRASISTDLDAYVSISKLLAPRWPRISTQQWLERLGLADAQHMLPPRRTSRIMAEVRTVFAVISIILRLKFGGLTRLMTLDPPYPVCCANMEVNQLAVADSALLWLRRLFGERRCLLKALAVSSALNIHGHACLLVFGYNSTPYSGRTRNNAMHVWVETEQSDLALVWGNMHEYLEVDRSFVRRTHL